MSSHPYEEKKRLHTKEENAFNAHLLGRAAHPLRPLHLQLRVNTSVGFLEILALLFRAPLEIRYYSEVRVY